MVLLVVIGIRNVDLMRIKTRRPWGKTPREKPRINNKLSRHEKQGPEYNPTTMVRSKTMKYYSKKNGHNFKKPRLKKRKKTKYEAVVCSLFYDYARPVKRQQWYISKTLVCFSSREVESLVHSHSYLDKDQLTNHCSDLSGDNSLRVNPSTHLLLYIGNIRLSNFITGVNLSSSFSNWKARDVCFSLFTLYGLKTDIVYLMNMSQY